MKKFNSPQQIEKKIEIGKSPTLKGIRCVVALRLIKKGEVIEICPVILIPKKEWKLIDRTVIGSYDYDWDKNNTALVLGYGSLYNHSYSANAKFIYLKNTIKYIAVKNIKEGEEIFVNYGGTPNCKKPLKNHYLNFNL